MKYPMTAVVMIAGLIPVSPAVARDPAPPPSGIVVHLFGQDSIMSNVLPTSPAPASGSTASVPANAAAQAQPASTPASTYVEPSAGDILHQMFVTGDPNNPPKPAPGRVADRPAN